MHALDKKRHDKDTPVDLRVENTWNSPGLCDSAPTSLFTSRTRHAALQNARRRGLGKLSLVQIVMHQ
jgi:hypothetical protein